ncbi:MAG: hypothetical protein IJ083_11425 [Clostridia bacterium]|nr:hypothetical protein [Clostridia bacterium]
MFRPELLLDASRQQRLKDAVPLRVSCQLFDGNAPRDLLPTLAYLCARMETEGVHLCLLPAEESLFSGTLLTFSRVSGCRCIVAVFAHTSVPLGRIAAGFSAEALCLECTSLGLGTCYMTGGYQKKQIQPYGKAGEELLCILAIGRPAEKGQRYERRRKDLRQLCLSDPAQWPEEVRTAAELVRLAPSAMNLQPWKMDYIKDTFSIDSSERTQFDLGCALAHAEVGLHTRHAWTFSTEKNEPMVRALFL